MILHYAYPPVFLRLHIEKESSYFISRIEFINEKEILPGTTIRIHKDPEFKKLVESVEEFFYSYFFHPPPKKLPEFRLRGTPFEVSVWKSLLTIPFGEVVTYGTLARRNGYPPTYARAVGNACRKNPVPIIIPCHRVIGKNNSLTGFSGGIEIKKWLLDYERTKSH